MLINHLKSIFLLQISSFDVTNGVSVLRGVDFYVSVIPSIIPMRLERFTIAEGRSKSLSINIIKIRHKHYKKDSLQYVVVKGPNHGAIEHEDQPNMSVRTFNQTQV